MSRLCTALYLPKTQSTVSNLPYLRTLPPYSTVGTSHSPPLPFQYPISNTQPSAISHHPTKPAPKAKENLLARPPALPCPSPCQKERTETKKREIAHKNAGKSPTPRHRFNHYHIHITSPLRLAAPNKSPRANHARLLCISIPFSSVPLPLPPPRPLLTHRTAPDLSREKPLLICLRACAEISSSSRPSSDRKAACACVGWLGALSRWVGSDGGTVRYRSAHSHSSSHPEGADMCESV